MSDAALTRLATAAGLLIEWEDASGEQRRVSPETLRTVLAGLGFPCATVDQCAESAVRLTQASQSPLRVMDVGNTLDVTGPARLLLEDGGTIDFPAGSPVRIDMPGFHRLQIGGSVVDLAVAPPCGHSVGGRPWGMAVQLYSLREGGAFGDFGALARFARTAAANGVDALAISPVHALFTADPHRYSPYSPSSREYLNPLFADLPDGSEDGPDLIDWPDAGPAKLARLRRAFDALDGTALDKFERYTRAADRGLIDHARFEVLHGHFFHNSGATGWQGWPPEYRDPSSAEVTAFAAAHDREVRFHLFLQWLTDASLAKAADAVGGMALGLIADIAVGLDKGGSHGWSRGDELMLGIGIGAPPDAFQAAGQNWGITSFSPFALKEKGYAPFLSLLRSAMRHAGGIRIDHALGLRRLWVVPDGASPLDGAYLTMPEPDLLRLIALESWRSGTVVIGEDLGVVPPGLRDELSARGILGMRVLPFERTERAFLPPAEWDARAVAMTSTHDLPPIAGWWRGKDIDWREQLDPVPDREPERTARTQDRTAFWQAATDVDVATGDMPTDPAPAVDAAIAYTAAAPCELLIVPAEDLFALDEAPNLPGTVDEHPNWRRRLPGPAETLFANPQVRRRIDSIQDHR